MTLLHPSPLTTLLHSLEETAARGEQILCRFCHAPITRSMDAMEAGGAHRYRVVNPHGITFELACFHQAPGCDIRGQATPEDSWFAGFSWQLAQCSDCHEHLGWYYERSGCESFFGLIATKLIARPTS